MTITTEHERTEGERLARVEAIVESLVREVSDLKQDARTYFIALLTLMITMWVTLMVAIIMRT